MNETITQEFIKSILKYDPQTGVFSWRKDRGSAKKGDVAGTKHHPHGYVYIKINKKNYKAARLAWLYMEGYFPEHCQALLVLTGTRPKESGTRKLQLIIKTSGSGGFRKKLMPPVLAGKQKKNITFQSAVRNQAHTYISKR